MINSTYFDKALEKARKKYRVPAVAVRVLDANTTLYSAEQGVRVQGGSSAVTAEDYFHIGSCAKSILVYVASKLMEQGTLEWSTKFFVMYPELKVSALEDYWDISFEDLVACRAGIKPYTSGAEAYPDLSASSTPKFDFMSYLLKLPPSAKRAPAGNFGMLYSNASYTLASAMLERAAGTDYFALIDRYVKKELALDVSVGWPNQISAEQPWGHYVAPGGSLTPLAPDHEYVLNSLIAPAGDLSMKPSDFSAYTQLRLRAARGEAGPALSALLSYADLKYHDFSLGSYNGRLFGHPYHGCDGSAGTFYARGIILPHENLAIVILINSGSQRAVDFITQCIAKQLLNWWWMFWV